MKKVLLLFVAFSVMYVGNASVSSGLFEIDEQEFYYELADLTALDEYVESNEGITLSSIDASSFLEDTQMMSVLAQVVDFWQLNEPPLGIPSFLWGCVLGWVGILITYLVSDDKEETKKALIGCVVQGGVVVLFYVFVFIVFATAATTTI